MNRNVNHTPETLIKLDNIYLPNNMNSIPLEAAVIIAALESLML